jgi:NAD(P)-dependent dehydrogenase (short-subunit alcohol dehydrogenase family)
MSKVWFVTGATRGIGCWQLGVFEKSTPQQIRAQCDTNVFGLMAVTRAVLPIMRKQQSGRIFNISAKN